MKVQFFKFQNNKKKEKYINNRVFQSDNLTKLKLKFWDKLFCDSTFKFCPRVGYQLFITHVIDESKNAYYMTSFSIIKNKTKSDYILIFKKLKEQINDFWKQEKIIL